MIKTIKIMKAQTTCYVTTHININIDQSCKFY